MSKGYKEKRQEYSEIRDRKRKRDDKIRKARRDKKEIRDQF